MNDDRWMAMIARQLEAEAERGFAPNQSASPAASAAEAAHAAEAAAGAARAAVSAASVAREEAWLLVRQRPETGRASLTRAHAAAGRAEQAAKRARRAASAASRAATDEDAREALDVALAQRAAAEHERDRAVMSADTAARELGRRLPRELELDHLVQRQHERIAAHDRPTDEMSEDLEGLERELGEARGMTPNPPSDEDLAAEVERLADYLNIDDPDPDDFRWLAEDWVEASGEEDLAEWASLFGGAHADVDELTGEQREAFVEWLKNDGRLMDPESPPYVYFTSARVVTDVWCLHFTDARRIDKLSRGAETFGLGITREHPTRVADCDSDYAQDVWVFAVPANTRGLRQYKRKYGDNAVLFFAPFAVLAYHTTDEEWQIIFPACSERHSVWIPNFDENNLTVECEDENGATFDCTFDSVAALIESIESGEARPHEDRRGEMVLGKPSLLTPNARTREATWERWRDLVNMTPSEISSVLERYPEAGLSRSEARAQGVRSGRDSGRALVRMLKSGGRSASQAERAWSDGDWEWAGRQVAFISRMRGARGPLRDKHGEPTRKLLSLWIWGHDPEKTS